MLGVLSICASSVFVLRFKSVSDFPTAVSMFFTLFPISILFTRDHFRDCCASSSASVKISRFLASMTVITLLANCCVLLLLLLRLLRCYHSVRQF